MKKSVAVKPDDTLSKIFTVTKTEIAGDLGKYLPETESWSVSSGKIKYLDKTVKIGTVEYQFNENEIYFYPENVTIGEAQQFSSGVPNMNVLHEKCKDNGILYSIFYYYIKTIEAFSKFNSEPLEVLFKNIVNKKFDVHYANSNRPALVDRLYYGGATSQVSDMIDNVVKKAQSRKNWRLAEILENQFKAKPNELSKKNTDTSMPTKRKISLTKDFIGGYDWKGIFNKMYQESKDSTESVTWSWDKVKSNLKIFKGFKDKKPTYIPSIVDLQARLDDDNIVKTDKKDILMYKYIPITKTKTSYSVTLKGKEYVEKDIDNLLPIIDSHVQQLLFQRSSEVSKLKVKDLTESLKSWLTKGVYGLPLSAYITYNTRGVTLTITHVNATDDELESVNKINEQIKTLQQQQLETSDDEEFNDLEEQIKELKSERQKINDVTVPHITMGDSVLTGIIFGSH